MHKPPYPQTPSGFPEPSWWVSIHVQPRRRNSSRISAWFPSCLWERRGLTYQQRLCDLQRKVPPRRRSMQPPSRRQRHHMPIPAHSSDPERSNKPNWRLVVVVTADFCTQFSESSSYPLISELHFPLRAERLCVLDQARRPCLAHPCRTLSDIHELVLQPWHHPSTLLCRYCVTRD